VTLYWPTKQFIERAHAKAIKIFGGTLAPFEGGDDFDTLGGETKRQLVNKFIRTRGAFDAVIDFDVAVRDPSHPTRLLPIYDTGGHLHPNDAGYSAMANAVDLCYSRIVMQMHCPDLYSLDRTSTSALPKCSGLKT